MENQPSKQPSGVVVKLPPGFRFHPTDEELVVQYLRRKALSYPLPASIIPDVHLNQYNPWDLPLNSGVGCGEKKERYLFNYRGEGGRSNNGSLRRVAGSGYWKSTGKEKMVVVGGKQVVGMKKVMVFYRGKKPSVIARTDWVLHEYSLLPPPPNNPNGGESKFSPRTSSHMEEGWVLCCVFQKKSRQKKITKNDSRLMESRGILGNLRIVETEILESSCVTQDSNEEDDEEEEQNSSFLFEPKHSPME